MLDANEIIPRLWIGAAPAPLYGVKGFDVVVMCAPLRDGEHVAEVPSGWMLAPFSDDIQPPTEREKLTIDAAVRWIVSQHKVGRRVLVLCREGRNRSGLVAALALASLTDIDAEARIRLVQQKRPGALYNWWFCEHIRGRVAA
jgi:protein-tyrosine phosphatase